MSRVLALVLVFLTIVAAWGVFAVVTDPLWGVRP